MSNSESEIVKGLFIIALISILELLDLGVGRHSPVL